MGQAVAHDGGQGLLGRVLQLQLKLLRLYRRFGLARDQRIASLRFGSCLHADGRHLRQLERQIEQRLRRTALQLKLDFSYRQHRSVSRPEFPLIDRDLDHRIAGLTVRAVQHADDSLDVAGEDGLQFIGVDGAKIAQSFRIIDSAQIGQGARDRRLPLAAAEHSTGMFVGDLERLNIALALFADAQGHAAPAQSEIFSIEVNAFKILAGGTRLCTRKRR